MNNITSLYIHIPFCLSKCKYCDFFSKPQLSNNKNDIISNDYITALCNELSARIKTFNCNCLETIYIGGGTPSLLTENQLSEILNTVNKFVQLSTITEITIEANPDDLTENLLKSYEKIGITRISTGIQSLNEKVLAFCGRRATRKGNVYGLELLQKYWKKDISLDLICGLPYETEETFIAGLKECIAFNPDHISMYSLTFEEETPFGKMLDNGDLEYDFDVADKMWLAGKNVLEEYGYNQYEVSNFSKIGKECLHNLTYWNHKNYIGAGCGATGTVYPDRWSNVNNIEEYVNFWNKKDKNNICNAPEIREKIESNTEIFEFFMMGLRKLSGVTDAEYMQIFNAQIPKQIINLFEKWKQNNLAEIIKENGNTRYFLNKNGILFLNKFLQEIEL